MNKIYIFATLFILIACTFPLFGQVHINEYSASNLNQFPDNFKKYEDWVELYNTADSPADISGWYLSDKENKPQKWKIPSNTIIPAKGFLVFWCSGRNTLINEHYHTNFKLSQTKGNETLVLAKPNGSVIDLIPLELTLLDQSRARDIDGTGDWKISEPSLKLSNENTPKFDRFTKTPTIDLAAGYYEGSQMATITSNEPDAVLRYTLDGTEPNENSPLYTSTIPITKTTILKAKSFSNQALVLPGKMDFSTFFIDESFSLVVFSIGAENVIKLANGDDAFRPIGSLEYFNIDKKRTATSYGELDRHGQDSWVLDQRSLDWLSRDEMGYSRAVKEKLFSYSDRESYQKFMFRASGDDNYPAIDDGEHDGSTHLRDEYVHTLTKEGGLKLDVRAVERAIVFLNGEYWGVYGLREKAVDHDYTDEYFKQGKRDIQYLTTWGDTEAEYGGIKAYEDWIEIRDFVLEKDMGNPDNYQHVKDIIQVQSLVDFMLMNLNTVAADWLNYNTGWWRGLDSKGKHEKWGYLIWDLDATFNFYINYTSIPNREPDALPCDINEISNAMDFFFSGVENCPVIIDSLVPYSGDDFVLEEVIKLDFRCCTEWGTECQELYDLIASGEGLVDNPARCPVIVNGSVTYAADDTIFIQVINADNFCCGEWDETCQALYDYYAMIGGEGTIEDEFCVTIEKALAPYSPDDTIFVEVLGLDSQCCENDWDPHCQKIYDQLAAGDEVTLTNRGDIGKHEKIFLKLLEESPAFKQLYLSRSADLMNTVFSCENMIETLDRMTATIKPEMPRQIERWGGTMIEWEANVLELKSYIEQRCNFLSDGLLSCEMDLSGPYSLTLMTQPDGIGEIDFNTLDIEKFPWTGNYFGGMDNLIKAKVFKESADQYRFSHWISTAENVIVNPNSKKSSIKLSQPDTLIAVFDIVSATNNINTQFYFDAYPNPATNHLILEYDLKEAKEVEVALYSILGQQVVSFPKAGGQRLAGSHIENLTLQEIASGLYFLVLNVEGTKRSLKINIIKN